MSSRNQEKNPNNDNAPIDSYSFEYKRHNPRQVECFIITPDKNKFSILINSAAEPPKEFIFNLFLERGKEFLLNIESKVIS